MSSYPGGGKWSLSGSRRGLGRLTSGGPKGSNFANGGTAPL